jgi:glycosyltransferase involved in cell wall biosynthesis
MHNSFTSLAILIPTFNPNQKTLDLVLELSNFQWNEIVIVNDGSSIESQIFFDKINKIENIKILNHSSNQGKGAALKT